MPVHFGDGFDQAGERQYQVSLGAAEAGKRLGLSPQEIIDMVKNSAVLTDPHANRRFRQYRFFVEDNTIWGIWLMEKPAERPARAQAPRNEAPHKENPSRQRRPVPSNLKAQPAGPSTYMEEFAKRTMVTETCPECNGSGCSTCRQSGTVTMRRQDFEELKRKSVERDKKSG
jgi:hypothetical protein